MSDQLQYLYGPLTALTNASKKAWEKFREYCRPRGAFFSPDDPPTKEELEEWRLWMEQVFMPLNIKMEQVIIDNTHLIEGDKIPDCFNTLLAHVETYKSVIKSWQSNSVSENEEYKEIVRKNTARLNFPRALDEHVSTVFKQLKERQSKLIGRQYPFRLIGPKNSN